ncbi:hypothetical protein HCN44_009193 [Aphidius gifuensis]|uniref:KH homology domain-containing protein 4 n=1 Tax=Aphidius gifuensis TaxID=684658 RepID=A0A834Y488_APHGI|nr:bromodomain-containing protein 4-like isoform X2 [Aphidius gifuensis]KAF7997795.1 hypothetical protein HCN44_009193 [Aphidius gifuensis]
MLLKKNTSMLMARGKYRGANGANKSLLINGSYKSSEFFSTEYDINETPPSARTLLTKGYIQDEINNFSGATVSTRGRFMTEQEKSRCPNERSLYLYIQGHEKINVDLAIQKINEIIKSEHQNVLQRPSRFTNAPPPLMSLHSGVSSVEKICVGIENAPPGFDLRGRIIGAGGANLLYIRGETGATVTLRGRGSQFTDPILGTESPEPLHLYIQHPKTELLQTAKQLAINLIQTMQSELQSYIQQQPPPVQSQQVLETSQLQQIQQAHFQTMNIGALGQSNVVTIQHQDIIQHPQSSVVTLPATILTATMAGGPGTGVPPPGVHIPSHSGSIGPQGQNQDIQNLISPQHQVGQVQLIGPPPTGQVQYQIHSGQPLHIQVPASSHSSQQPVTQMYVMSQPPPQSPGQPGFSSAAPVNGTVSYVYTQPNMQRPPTPQTGIETVNVNLQQPPPSAPLNITHQPPPPSLLHLHFPPPNFPPNQPPPPIPQTYQIQYQQVQTESPQTQQFVLQSGEHIVSHNTEQHIIQSQFDVQPPQFQHQIPPPTTQTFLVPTSQSPVHHSQQASVGPDGGIEQGQPPQPVPPPPQMVPPPNQMNLLTSVPPPNQQQQHQQQPPQNAPWLFQAHQPPPQGQIQVQMPPSQGMHNIPHSQVQTQIHYTQQLQYQNEHQVHYAVQPPHHSFELHKPDDSQEQQTGHGVKRRFNDPEGPQEGPAFYCGPPPIHRHGNGEEERQQLRGHGPPPGQAHGERNKPLMPLPHPGEKHNMESKQPRLSPDEDFGPMMPPGQVPSPAPWQGPWMRPLPPPPPPTNMPPPQIRPTRGQTDVDQNRSLEHHINAEHNQMPPYNVKPPPYNNSLPLMQSICNPPPPPPLPPPHHHHHHSHSHPHHSHYHQNHQQRPQFSPQHYQIPVSQSYQPPNVCNSFPFNKIHQ